MKNLLFALLLPVFIYSQDIAGQYTMSGFDSETYYISRTSVDLSVTSDVFGLSIIVNTLPAGEIFNTVRTGPYGIDILNMLSVNLNLDLQGDGSGEITEGSSYPVIFTDPDNCLSSIMVIPVNNIFIYTSDAYLGIINYGVNILGGPSISSYAGVQGGGMGIFGSNVFPAFPMIPQYPTLCDYDDNCIDIVLPEGSVIEGGSILPGVSGGYILKEGLNAFGLQSIVPNNPSPDFYLEINTIDGILSGSGFGEFIGVDEDGDGTDFDEILGLPYITVTMTNPACGFNYSIFGDVGSILPAECNMGIDVGNEAYVMDASFSDFGGFLTYNAVMYSLTSDASFLANDGDHDFNGDDGRLVMNFDPTCIPVVKSTTFIGEFLLVNDCYDLGDVNGDGGLNVLDVVSLANCVLGQNCAALDNSCAADMNDDDNYNVLDVVVLVNIILEN